MCYRQSWSIRITNLWPKSLFSWLFTFSFTRTCTPKRNSGTSPRRDTLSVINVTQKWWRLSCVVTPAGWTQRSGWRRWRCCCLRAVKRASGWCSTWLDRRDERSPSECFWPAAYFCYMRSWLFLSMCDSYYTSTSDHAWNGMQSAICFHLRPYFL